MSSWQKKRIRELPHLPIAFHPKALKLMWIDGRSPGFPLTDAFPSASRRTVAENISNLLWITVAGTAPVLHRHSLLISRPKQCRPKEPTSAANIRKSVEVLLQWGAEVHQPPIRTIPYTTIPYITPYSLIPVYPYTPISLFPYTPIPLYPYTLIPLYPFYVKCQGYWFLIF